MLQIKSTEDFPKVMHKPYIVQGIAQYQDELRALHISSYGATGAYKNFIEAEQVRINELIDFLNDKLKVINEEIFKKQAKGLKTEPKAENKPKKPRTTKTPKKPRKKKSIIESITDTFTDTDTEKDT